MNGEGRREGGGGKGEGGGEEGGRGGERRAYTSSGLIGLVG